MNNEVEKLEEQNAELRVEIEKYKGQGGNTENQRKKLLKVRIDCARANRC